MIQVELQRMTEEWLSEALTIYKDDQSREAIRLRVFADEIRACWQDIAELKLAHAKMTVLLKGVNDERETLKAQLEKAREAMEVKNEHLKIHIQCARSTGRRTEEIKEALSAGQELMTNQQVRKK